MGGCKVREALPANIKSAPSRAIPPTMNLAIQGRPFPQGRSDSATKAETKSSQGGITPEVSSALKTLSR